MHLHAVCKSTFRTTFLEGIAVVHNTLGWPSLLPVEQERHFLIKRYGSQEMEHVRRKACEAGHDSDWDRPEFDGVLRPALVSDVSAAKWPIIVRHLWLSLSCMVKVAPPPLPQKTKIALRHRSQPHLRRPMQARVIPTSSFRFK